MHDRIYLFDISTAAEFWCDTPKNFDNPTENLTFLPFLGGEREDTRDGLEVRQMLS
jgi:hypothetical protein